MKTRNRTDSTFSFRPSLARPGASPPTFHPRWGRSFCSPWIMYAKVFKQIYDSSIADNWKTRVVFQDMLILADSDGIVDMTHESLARRTKLPLKMVKLAITELESPDERSRSHEEEGRRLIRIDPHRNWGWRIVNYLTYRKMKEEFDRKAYMRRYMQKKRSGEVDEPVKPVLTQSLTESNLLTSSPSPSSYKKATTLKEEGDSKGGRSTYEILRDGLCRLYERDPKSAWGHDEETALFDVSKRAGCVEELGTLRNYQRSNGKYFPKSIVRLLEGWTKNLDAAKSFDREPSNRSAKTIAEKDMEALCRQIKKECQ